MLKTIKIEQVQCVIYNINEVFMDYKLQLNTKAILQKKFNGAKSGYNALEVDSYLDQIIEDYEKVENGKLLSIKDYDILIKKIETLMEKNKNLEIELSKCKSRLKDIKETDSVNKDNIDLLKRINSLEKFIYEKGFDPSTIK